MSRPEGGFARGWEIAMKQKPARILLGAANIPWLTFQVASNAFLTGLGGGFNPLDVYGAMKMWRGMTPDEQIAWETEIGITRGGHQHIDQRHLGSTKDRYTPIKHIVDFWQAYRHSKVGRYGPQTAPRHLMDLMFKADEAQNNFFRKVLFYNQIKRDAYKEMGARTGHRMDREKSEIVAILKKPPNEAIHAVMRNPAALREARPARQGLPRQLPGVHRPGAPAAFAQRHVLRLPALLAALRLLHDAGPAPDHGGDRSGDRADGLRRDQEALRSPAHRGAPDALPGTGLLRRPSGCAERGPAVDQHRSDESGAQPGGGNGAALPVVGLVSPIYGLLAEQIAEESLFTGKDWALSGQPRAGHARAGT
jgi:hypothetical protein